MKDLELKIGNEKLEKLGVIPLLEIVFVSQVSTEIEKVVKVKDKSMVYVWVRHV